MSCIVEVKNLSFSYPNQSVLLKGICFEVKPAVFLALTGPNGTGKTTLLKLLCGLLRADEGSVKINSEHIESYSARELAQKVAVVWQEFVPVFDFTVAEIVAMARTPYLGTFGFAGRADREIVDEAIEITDTARFASRPLGQLSAGERQRVFIARAIAQDTAILLLDEPTNFLDLKHQVDIYDLLKRMQLERAKTIIAVTHDINLASQYADVVLLLTAGSGYHIGKAGDVFSAERIEKVFGTKTFAGRIGSEKFFIPLGRFAKDSNTITGEIPDSREK